ncbi:MAG: lipopolysaccharide heptosyltransferase II [Bryobacteraceae bacterium]
MTFSRILVRATNWVGDAVMSLPAIREIRGAFPRAHLAVLARPWVADLYRRELAIDRVIPYTAASGPRDWTTKWRAARDLRRQRFDCAILLQNAFEAALVTWLARIPVRIGYDRDARGCLLTRAVPVPNRGEIPAHQRHYYFELLRRAGLIEGMPHVDSIRLEGIPDAVAAGRARLQAAGVALPLIGVSPGAAYGNAKRWIPEHFAEAAAYLARTRGASVALFGSTQERPLCETIAAMIPGTPVHVFAGTTSLGQFIEMAAACELFLTNDSGAMHIASALAVPTVTIFGATDDVATGPTGPLTRIVRQPVECSPCLLRECPIPGHPCMTRVKPDRVAAVALELLASNQNLHQ